jgi:hypothetical protein
LLPIGFGRSFVAIQQRRNLLNGFQSREVRDWNEQFRKETAMSSNFDTIFAWAASQPQGDNVSAQLVVTTIDTNNTVTYAAVPMTYTAGVPRSPLRIRATPAQLQGEATFSQGTNNVGQLWNTITGSDGGPFGPQNPDPIRILITAPYDGGFRARAGRAVQRNNRFQCQ